MKVSLLSITKHGRRKERKYRDLVEENMRCPQCDHCKDDPQPHADATPFYFIKMYSPTVLKEITLTDLEYGCNRCEAEWIIQIEEENERS